MTDDGVTEWNGHAVPPRPPLPVPPADPAPPIPAPEPAQAPDATASARPAPTVRKIGMPPGMEPSLDTVPSSDHAAPIPVAKPEFGLAPTPIPTPTGGIRNEPSAPVTAPAPVATPQRNPRLVLPDGQVLPLDHGIIVGRDPQHQDGYGVTERATLHDVERSVSKTHAVIGFSEGRVWVLDLNSTNGTVLIDEDGAETLCTPEVATPVPANADVRFGEYRVRITFD